MNSHYELSNVEFEENFANASLKPSLFNHEAHLRLAWIYILKYGEKRAMSKVCKEIQQFDRVHGDGTKFNTTVTVAAVKIVYHFLQKSKSSDFSSFLMEFPKLKGAFKDLLDQHYKMDIFSSEKARHNFVEPDLLPFD